MRVGRSCYMDMGVSLQDSKDSSTTLLSLEQTGRKLVTRHTQYVNLDGALE